MRLLLAPLFFILVAAHATATAQTLIQPDTAVEGRLSDESERLVYRSTNWRLDCYILDTRAGESFVVDMESSALDGYLMVGRGFDCASAESWDDEDANAGNGDNARLGFTSGGGAYLIAAANHLRSRGPYTLRVTRTNRRSGTLPPAHELRLPEPGAASTISGTNNANSSAPGQAFRDCDTCPSLVVVPGGSFMMGSPPTEEGRESNEGPRHVVTIGRAFAMGQFEVTFDEYDACVAAQRCRSVADNGWGRGRRPVVNVSYIDAQRYVRWLSDTTGHAYFLPSEAEWEYAARAGTDTPWNTGSAIITDDANLLNAAGRTVVVGSYPPNAFGLHDVHGNVSEWTQDCADVGYQGAPTDGSAATSGNCQQERVIRGGSFATFPADARSARRHLRSSGTSSQARGFRVARAL